MQLPRGAWVSQGHALLQRALQVQEMLPTEPKGQSLSSSSSSLVSFPLPPSVQFSFCLCPKSIKNFQDFYLEEKLWSCC